MKSTQFTIYLCMTVLVFASGCASPQPRDPLPASEGWRVLYDQDIRKLPQDIINDYQAYIQKLPRKERIQLTESSLHFSGNKNGQHAVSFDIKRPAFIGFTIWTYVLVYDKDNKRIKATQFKSRGSL